MIEDDSTLRTYIYTKLFLLILGKLSWVEVLRERDDNAEVWQSSEEILVQCTHNLEMWQNEIDIDITIIE